jgi:hypothetical protein
MTNWEIIKDKWKEWIYINWACYIHEPIKWDVWKHIREYLQSENNFEAFFDLILFSKFEVWVQ